MDVHPSPFSDKTEVTVFMPHQENVRIEMFDALGRSVRVLHDGRLDYGKHSFLISADDLPAGAYYYNLQGETVHAEGRAVLVR